MTKRKNFSVNLIYHLGYLLTLLFRVFRLAELIIIVCSSVVLSIDYPFRMKILDDIYLTFFPLIWFFSGIGFYTLMKIIALIF